MTELLGNNSPLQIICFPPVLNLMTLRPTPFPSLPYKTISRCRCNVGAGRALSLLCEMYRKYELTCVGPRFIFGVKTHEFCLIELPLYPSDIGL